eukprot:TRINITY_DN517_c3_g1_i4.p1 TRINITY_DN517_c3_g1~~TRINITY_DN517_c3_g1_i4.p1  ORF type:complete len:350 (+),score=66.94 TRINITY_DN517_c3_g1_i4:34-1050(+)
MEIRGVIRDAHSVAVLCVAIFNGRLYTGGDDSIIRVWDYDTLKLYKSLPAHNGPVTCLETGKECKTLFSASSDGTINVWIWNSGLKIVSVTKTLIPISCLCWSSARRVLLVTGKESILMFSLQDGKKLVPAGKLDHHSDIVTSVMVHEGKILSGSHDRSIHVVDPATGRSLLKIPRAHKAGVSALAYDTDTDTITSGSYDQRVKVWSKDGVCMHELKGLSDTVTGLEYNPVTKTIWVAANSPQPLIFDAASVINVTEYVSGVVPAHRAEMRLFQKLYWFQETQEMMGTTNLREVIVWRWSPTRPVTTLHVGDLPPEALCYSPSMVPTLDFTCTCDDCK